MKGENNCKPDDIKNCKLWVFLTFLFLFLLIIFTQYENMVRFVYGCEIRFNNGVLKVSGDYYFIPEEKKHVNKLEMLGVFFRDLCRIPVCKVYDISKLNFENKKKSETLYEFVKRNWLEYGRVVRHRKLGDLIFDEWYAFDEDKAGYIIIIFPKYNLLFSFYNSGQIDDFLNHLKIKKTDK